MLADIFDPGHAPDLLLRAADERACAASCLVGIAANRCFETRSSVRIDSLVKGLNRADLPPMPRHDAPVPMPPRRKLALRQGTARTGAGPLERYRTRLNHRHRPAGDRCAAGRFRRDAALLLGHDASASLPPHALQHAKITSVPVIQPDPATL